MYDADVDDEEHEERYAVDEYDVAVGVHDRIVHGILAELGEPGLVVIAARRLLTLARIRCRRVLAARCGGGAGAGAGGGGDRHGHGLDLEPFGQVVDDAEGEQAANCAQRVLHRADGVHSQRHGHIEPAIDGHRARQVDGEHLKGGEYGRPTAVQQIHHILVHAHCIVARVVCLLLLLLLLLHATDQSCIGAIACHVGLMLLLVVAVDHVALEHLVGEHVAKRVQEEEVDEAHDVRDGERGEIGVRGEVAHLRMEQHDTREAVECYATDGDRHHKVCIDDEAYVNDEQLVVDAQVVDDHIARR